MKFPIYITSKWKRCIEIVFVSFHDYNSRIIIKLEIPCKQQTFSFRFTIDIQHDFYPANFGTHHLQWRLYKGRSFRQSWHRGSWLPLPSFWPRWGRVRLRKGRWWRKPWRPQPYPGRTDLPPSSGRLPTNWETSNIPNVIGLC